MEIEWAVTAIPLALIAVAGAVAKLVALFRGTVSHWTASHHWRWWSDVVAYTTGETVVQNMAQQAIECIRAHTVKVRCLWDGFTSSSIVAGLGNTVPIRCVLTFRATKAWCAQTQWGFLAWDAGATIITVKAATWISIIIAGWTSEALKKREGFVLYLSKWKEWKKKL